jgi:hypothetical protein
MRKFEKVKDLDSFLNELVRSAMWEIGYHERALHKRDKAIKMAKEVIEGAGFNFHEMDDDEETERDLSEEGFESIQSLCDGVVQEILVSRRYHEDGLQKAHNELASIKIMLSRGNFYVDMAAISAEVQSELDEKKA